MSSPRDAALPLLAALIAVLVVVGPALGHGDILGLGYNDLHGTLWFRWQLLDALETGRSVAVTPLVAHPAGTDLLVRNGLNLLDAALSLPLVAALGPFAGHDAWAVVLVAANALAFHRLAGALGLGAWTRAWGSLVFALSPFLVSELGGGRPTQAFVPFLCLGLRQALRLDEDPRAWAWMGLHLALTGLTYWYAAVWGGLLMGLTGLTVAPRRALKGALAALGLVSPWLAAYALRSPDALALPALGDNLHPLVVLWWTGEQALLDPERGAQPSPLAMFPVAGPELPAGLALAVVLARGRRAWRAMALASVLCLALALGPRAFDLVENPLYAAWASLGPLARRLWFPSRATLVPALVAALALSVGVEALLARWPRAGRPLSVLALALWVGALRGLDVLPLPTWSPPQPAPLAWLARQPEGAAVALPEHKESTWLVHQLQHHKPVQLQLGGRNPALAVPALDAWEARHPALVLWSDVLRGFVPARPVEPEELRALERDGFRYLLIDLGALDGKRSPKQIDATRRRLLRLMGEPDAEGGGLMAWDLAATASRIDPA